MWELDYKDLSAQELATWCEEMTHLKRPWFWERLKVREGDDRGWDGWMASPTQWTWVWVNSGSWCWTERPVWCAAVCGVTKSQTRLSDWTELNWRHYIWGWLVNTARENWYTVSVTTMMEILVIFTSPLPPSAFLSPSFRFSLCQGKLCMVSVNHCLPCWSSCK